MQLSALSRNCFVTILNLRGLTDLDGKGARQAYQGVRAEIDRMITLGLCGGCQRQDVVDACYAVAALADAVGSRCHAELVALFQSRPLLAHFFQTNQTNADFYQRLEALQKGRKVDVMEIYATALALGYRGRLRSDDAERLQATLVTTAFKADFQLLSQPRRQPWARGPQVWLWLAPWVASFISLILYIILSAAVHSEVRDLITAVEAAADLPTLGSHAPEPPAPGGQADDDGGF